MTALDRRTRADVFGPGIPVAAAHYRIVEPIPPHVHDFIELAVLTDGCARYETADGPLRLQPGDVVVVRPGGWHAYGLLAGSAGFGVTNAYLGPELVHGPLGWLLDYPRLARLLLTGGRLDPPLTDDACSRVQGWLAQLAAEPPGRDPRMRTCLIGCVLVELSRSVTSGSAPGLPPITPAVRASLQALTDDLAHPWTVAELAERAGLSVSSLYRQFRTQLGSGPVEWLTRSRAERAATLLSQTTLPVAAVGRRVGWPDPSYASRRFHQVYAMAPSEYRARHGR